VRTLGPIQSRLHFRLESTLSGVDATGTGTTSWKIIMRYPTRAMTGSVRQSTARCPSVRQADTVKQGDCRSRLDRRGQTKSTSPTSQRTSSGAVPRPRTGAEMACSHADTESFDGPTAPHPGIRQGRRLRFSVSKEPVERKSRLSLRKEARTLGSSQPAHRAALA